MQKVQHFKNYVLFPIGKAMPQQLELIDYSLSIFTLKQPPFDVRSKCQSGVGTRQGQLQFRIQVLHFANLQRGRVLARSS